MAAVLCMAVLGTAYVLLKKKAKAKALVCKAAATCVPFLLLTADFLASESGSPGAVLYGWTAGALLFYIAADVLLECRFVIGAAAFSCGHICMAAGFLTGGELTNSAGTVPGQAALAAGCLALTVMFVAAACLALRKYLPHLKTKRLLLPAVSYVVILSMMASLAVSAGIRSGGERGAVTAAGGICFVISDILLGNQPSREKTKQCKRGSGAHSVLYFSVSAGLKSVGILKNIKNM